MEVMNGYSSQPQPLHVLVFQSVKNYWKVFKAVFILMLVLVAIKDLYTYFNSLSVNHWLRLTVIAITLLIEIFLWSVAIYNAHQVWLNVPVKMSESLRLISQKSIRIFMGFLLLLILFCAIILIGYWLSYFISQAAGNEILIKNICLIFFVGLPILFFIIMFFFTIPLLVIESPTVLQAFKQSFYLVGYKNWFKTFFIYFIIVVLSLIVSPNTLQGHWLMAHHLYLVADLAICLLISPIVLNLMVLLLHDLKLRQLPTSGNTDLNNSGLSL